MFLDVPESMIRTESRGVLETRAIASKVKSLNTVLSNLMQKKIRIDLEMKRTKVKIQNLKKLTSTDLKASLKFESHRESVSHQELEDACARVNLSYAEMLDLFEALTESENLCREYDANFAKYILET